MASFEHLDLLLGQALECMDEAAGEIKALSPFNQKDLLNRIGRSIVELWEVRTSVYEMKPEIKRDFVAEYSNDKLRYEKLSDIHAEAVKAEEQGDQSLAVRYYSELLSISKYGYFKLLAEAGLYRSSVQTNGKP
jgi:hypothetical protein